MLSIIENYEVIHNVLYSLLILVLLYVYVDTE